MFVSVCISGKQDGLQGKYSSQDFKLPKKCEGYPASSQTFLSYIDGAQIKIMGLFLFFKHFPQSALMRMNVHWGVPLAGEEWLMNTPLPHVPSLMMILMTIWIFFVSSWITNLCFWSVFTRAALGFFFTIDNWVGKY